MTRQTPLVTIALCIAATAMVAGCQRPLGSASGPYGPAGTLAPASSQPLIPFGPMSGATRVPPPPTGSSSVSNGYDGQPAAMSSASQSYAGGSSPSAGSFASAGQIQSSASGARTALGGMPVIDLTAGMMDSPAPPPIAAVAQSNGGGPTSNSVAIGSGVAPASWQGETNISVAPVDLASRLRPLDPAQAAALVPLPTAPDDAAPAVAMTQYRSEASASPAWQAVQPASALSAATGNAFEQRSAPAAYAAQSPAGSIPSTEPVQTQPGDAAASSALLWRNPSVAR